MKTSCFVKSNMKLILPIFVLICISIACEHEKTTPSGKIYESDEGLTFENDSLIASLDEINIKPEDLVFFDGETLDEFLSRPNKKSFAESNNYKSYINLLFQEGSRLTRSEEWIIPEGVDPILEPKQIGLAYVFNKDNTINERKKNGECDNRLFGLDCSAMVVTMLQKTGLKISDLSASELANANHLNKLMKNSGYQNLRYVDKGRNFLIDSVDNGDIIYFFNNDNMINHVGMVFLAGNRSPLSIKPYIYQSNGTSFKSIYELDKNGNTVLKSKGCEFNFPPDRGPRCVPLINFINLCGKRKNNICESYPFSNYGVLKLMEDLGRKELLSSRNWRLEQVWENNTNTIQSCEKDDIFVFYPNGSYRMFPNSRCRAADGTLEDWGYNSEDGWTLSEDQKMLKTKNISLIDGFIQNYFRSNYGIKFSSQVLIKYLDYRTLIISAPESGSIDYTLVFKASI